MSWWPHQIYRLKSDELFDHEFFSTDPSRRHYHQSYIEGELNEKKLIEKILEEAFKNESKQAAPAADNSEALVEEVRKLKAKLKSV